MKKYRFVAFFAVVALWCAALVPISHACASKVEAELALRGYTHVAAKPSLSATCEKGRLGYRWSAVKDEHVHTGRACYDFIFGVSIR